MQRLVMVVDDDAYTRDIVQTVLEYANHTVICCADADQALQALQSHQPDVILMDVEMPKRDGISLAREIRSTARLRESVLVAFTGYAIDDIRHRLNDNPFVEVLTKPVPAGRLIEVVERYIDEGSVARV